VGCKDGERGILALDVIFHWSEYLLIQRHHVHHHFLLKFDWLKLAVFLLAESANSRRRKFSILCEYLLIQRHHVHHHLLLKFDWLKHTVFPLVESANTSE
jgi:hypothetical protein